MPGMWGSSINGRKSTVVNQQLFLSNKVAEANDIKVDPVTGVATNNASTFFEKSNVVFEDLLTTPDTIVRGNMFVGGQGTLGSYTLDVSGSINAKSIFVNGLPVGSGSGNVDLTPVTNRLTVLEASANKVDVSLNAHNTRIGAVETKLTSVSYSAGATSFTTVVSGVTPTDAAHLATKGYVDSNAGTALLNTDNSWNGLNKFTRMTVSSDASFNAGVYFGGNVTIDSSKILNVGQINATDLVVSGTTTTVNSDDLKVKDKVVTLNVGGGAVVGAYKGSGIEVEGNAGSGTAIVANIFVDNDGEWALRNVGAAVDKIMTRNTFGAADLTLSGNLSVGNRLAVTGDVSLNGRVRVVGDVSLNSEVGVLGNVAVAKGLTVGQRLVLVGDASLNANVVVGGDASFNGRVRVVGDVSLNSEVGILGNVAVGKGLTVGQRLVTVGDASLNANVVVGGDASFNGRLRAVGDVSLNSEVGILGNVAVGKGLTVGQRLVTVGDASLNANVVVGGDASFNGRVRVVGDVSLNSEVGINGNVAVTKGLTIGQRLVLVGDASLNASVVVGGDASFNGRLRAVGDVSLNSEVGILGNVAVGKGLTVGQRLVLVGDASLNANVVVGGDASFNGRLRAVGDVSLNSEVGVLGNVAVAKGLTVGQRLVTVGDASLNANVVVGGDTSFNGRVRVVGDVSMNSHANVSGNLRVGDDVHVGHKLFVTSDITASADVEVIGRITVGKNSNFSANVDVAGNLEVHKTIWSRGDISLNGNMVVAGNTQFQRLPYTTLLAIDVSNAVGNVFTTKDYVNTEISRVLSSSGGANLAANNVFTGLNSFTQDLSLNSRLVVGGDVSLNKEAAVLGNLSVAKGLTVTQKLVAVGDASLNANVVIGGDASFNGRLRAVGDVSLNAEVGILGNLTVSQKLVAVRDASLNANVVVGGDASFNGRLRAVGDVSLNAEVGILGNLTVSQKLVAVGDASLNANVIVGGDASFNGRLRAVGDVSLNAEVGVMGNLAVSKGITVGQRLVAVGDASLNANVIVGGDASFNGRLRAVGDVSLNAEVGVIGNLAVSKGVTVGQRLVATGDSSFNGNLQVVGKNFNFVEGFSSGNLSVGQTLYSNTIVATTLQVTGTTVTVNTANLAVSDNVITLNKGANNIPAGGSGIEVESAGPAIVGSLALVGTGGSEKWSIKNVGDSAYSAIAVASDLSRTDVSVNAALTRLTQQSYTSGLTTIAGNVTLADSNSKLLVSGDASLNAKLSAAGDVSFGGKLYVGGITTLGALGAGATTLSTLTANTLTLNNDASLNSNLFVGKDASFGGNVLFSQLPLTTVTNFSSADGNAFVTKSYVASVTSGGVTLGGDNAFTGNVSFSKLPTTTVTNFSTADVNAFVTKSYVTSLTAALPTNSLSDYGNTFSGNSSIPAFTGSAISSSGQYILAIKYSASDASNYRVSTDYGASYFIPTNTSGATNTFPQISSVAMSANGQYQYICSSGYIHRSDNYGANLSWRVNGAWDPYAPFYLLYIAVSSSGQYVFGIGNVSGAANKVYLSSNYGYPASAYTELTGTGGLPATLTGFPAMSSDGQVLCINSNSNLYISTNYGSSWSTIATSGDIADGIALSSNGQYIAYVKRTATTGTPGLYLSSNYGTSFSLANNATNLSKCTMSATGQFIIVTDLSGNIVYTTNYGATWTTKAATATSWTGAAPVANASAPAVTPDGLTFVLPATNDLRIYTNNVAQTYSSDSLFTGKLTVNGDTTLANVSASRLFLSSDASLNGKLSVGSDVSFAGKLNVVGNTTLANVSASTLLLSSDASLNGKLSVGSDVSFAGKLNVVGNTTLANVSATALSASTLLLSSDASLNGKLSVGSDVSFAGKLNVVGNTTLANASATTLTVNNTLFAGNINSTNVNIYGNLSVMGTTTTITTTNLDVCDNVVTLNKSANSIPVSGSGIEVESGGATVGSLALVGTSGSEKWSIKNVGDSAYSAIAVASDLSRTDVSVNAALTRLTQQSYTTGLTTIAGNVTLADANSKLLVVGDASLNAKLSVGTDVSFGGRMNLTGDASFNGALMTVGGNVQLGTGVRGVAINKVPSTTYALDVSGQSFLAGNVFIYKHPNDASTTTNPFVDMSNVNLNLFGVAEKFTFPTYTAGATSLTLDCATSTIFDISGVTAAIQNISFTNVPATVGRSVSITVLLHQATANKANYFTGTQVSVNGYTGGTIITLSYPDGTTTVTAPTNNCSLFIHQFVILWRAAATAPKVIMYTSSIV